MPFAYEPRRTTASVVEEFHVEPGAMRAVYVTATPVDEFAVDISSVSLAIARVRLDEFPQWVSYMASTQELDDSLSPSAP